MKLIPGIIVFVSLLAGCTKPEKGPAGSAGADGKQPTVEAEVISVFSSSWAISADSVEWEVSVPVSKLTQTIVDKGMVQVFIKRDNNWCAVPYLEDDEFIIFSYAVGKIDLVYGTSHHLLPPNPKTDSYKIVLLTTP